MSANNVSTIVINRDVSAVATVNLSVQETGVRVRAIPTPGGTVVNLPAKPFPNDGDSYEVIDGDGSCSPANLLTVAAPAGTTIRGLGVFVMSTPFASAWFTFDAAADSWIVTFSAGGASPTIADELWIDVAAGTTLAPTLAQQFLSCDTSGAQTTINLPTAAAAINGQMQLVKLTGNMLSPVIINAGAGTTVELANAPGTFGASTWLPIQGSSFFLKYDKATTQWKCWATETGTGAPGTTAYNPGWYALADIFWDPQAGVDSNAGTVGFPVATPAEIYRRWGGVPTLVNNSQIIHQVTADLGTTRYSFRCLSGNPNIGLTVIGVSALKGAAFAAGAVTAISRANPGNDMQVAGFPGGAAVGDLVHNTTLDTYAWIDAIGGGVATLTPPFNPPPSFGQGVIWVAGNTLQLLTPPNSNADILEGDGGAANAGGFAAAVQGEFLTLTDSSGTPGDSVFTLRSVGATANLFACNVQSFAVLDAQSSPGFSPAMVNCFLGSGGQIVGSGNEGSDVANALVLGGRLGATGFDSLIAGATVSNDCIVRGSLETRGFNVLSCHLVTALNVEGPRTKGGATGIWGAGTINVRGPSAFTLSSGLNTFANLIKVGALQINGAATASTYTGLGVNADGVAITSATIDAQAAMFNVKTGGRYAVTVD